MEFEPELLSQLVGVIYDAALDTTLWPDVLKRCCEFVGGVTANLFAQDAARTNVQTFYTWGDNPDYTRLYHEKYLTLNPVFPVGMFIPVGEVLCQADILPHEEMRQTRFYKEWMQPQGIIDFVGCNLEKSATSAAAFAIMRNEQNGYVDDEARRRMALIAPHVRRAVLIGKVIDLQKVEAAMMADTLDGLATAMFLIDAGSRIVHANVAGQTMIAGGQILRAPSGRIRAIDSAADQTIHETFAAATQGDTEVGNLGISVPLPASDGELYVAHVLPLTSAQRRRANVSYAAVAAMFVHKANRNLVPPLEALSARFRLTPTETRVLLALVNVGSVAEVAEVLGIGEGTVRTHLHHLFGKTGARGQVDLVKLVAGFTSPLAG